MSRYGPRIRKSIPVPASIDMRCQVAMVAQARDMDQIDFTKDCLEVGVLVGKNVPKEADMLVMVAEALDDLWVKKGWTQRDMPQLRDPLEHLTKFK
jgi:hypothetical protein